MARIHDHEVAQTHAVRLQALMRTLSAISTEDFSLNLTPRGILPEVLAGGVRRASGNPYPISDQNV